MNDKQQLAAMGAQYRLTEEQAKGLAERMPQTGALQVIDDEPMCMARRIDELEAQVRVMAELLRETQECVVHDVVRGMGRDVESLWARIDATLAGNLPIHSEQPLAMVLGGAGNRDLFERWFMRDYHPDRQGPHIKDIAWAAWQAALAAPKPEAK